ncbi:MAG: alkaline phosphatase [Bacteroidaceae bacterium]|nr:alkaline phosphatase [Bacteroidaceae bacterium]
MKKTFLLVCLSCICLLLNAKTAKYVFYLISDGTGVNLIQAAEHYRADIEGYTKQGLGGDVYKYANKPFRFSTFPVVGMATTYSASSRTTDSAAAGTALATGHKTNNGMIGMLPDETPVYSIAKTAKEQGMMVGVGSSVTINHATPCAFYAHNKNRSNYHEIAHDLLECDYVDFFCGSNINHATDEKVHPNEKSIYELAEDAGFTVCYGTKEYAAKGKKAKKVILVQPQDSRNSEMQYFIDRKPGDMTIEEVFGAQLDYLYSNSGKKGFFLMNEIGGRVDWAAHARDGATAFLELEAVNNCVEAAYEFYLQHPDETLIILTADHDTSGPALGNTSYQGTPKAYASQKIAKDSYTDYLARLRKETNNNVSWEQIEQSLKDLWGFWTVHKLSDSQTKLLRDTYEETFGAEGRQQMEKTLYKSNEKMSVVACDIMTNLAKMNFVHGAHTSGYVPVYAIGVGADEFKGMNDTSEIPQKIARIMGTELK